MLSSKKYCYIFLCVFLVGIFNRIYSLNIEELKPLNYEVDILQTPIKKGEEQALPVIHMTSRYGQEYQCLLPQIEDDDMSEKEAVSEKNTDIKELLKPMKAASCLLKGKDWWTYEFCFGHYIKQFHIEDGQIIGQVITLGLYDSDYDWNNETDQEKFKNVKQRYHSQFYVNGTKCDLTGQPRNAEVRLYCEEDAGDYIYRVDEPGTCSYIITIHTSRLCSHPLLKPLPSKRAHVIPCHPLLNEEQYSVYIKKYNEEKELADQKRSQWLNNQQARLQVMKKENQQQLEIEELSRLKAKIEKEARSIASDELSILKNNVREIETEDPISSKEKKVKTGSDEESVETFLFQEYDRGKQVESDDLQHVSEATENSEMQEAALDTEDVSIESSDPIKNEIPDRKDSLVDEGASKVFEDKPESILDDDELHVRIRRLDRKTTDSNGKLYEMDSIQRKKLEQAVKEKLEKAGLDTGGRRIEVKIIQAGYYDNEEGKDFHTLSDAETNQFQNMIMALLTGQQEAVQEMERHKKLEENYKFTWDNTEEKDD